MLSILENPYVYLGSALVLVNGTNDTLLVLRILGHQDENEFNKLPQLLLLFMDFYKFAHTGCYQSRSGL